MGADETIEYLGIQLRESLSMIDFIETHHYFTNLMKNS